MAITKSHKKDWRSLVTLVISILGLLYFVVQTVALSGLLLFSSLNSRIDTSENIILGMLIWYSFLSLMIIVPVFLTSLCDYREKPIPRWMDTNRPGVKKGLLWSILVLPVIFFIGWIVSGHATLSVFFLGLINVLVTGIPVLWVSQVGQAGINGGSQSRKWRIFGFSFTIMPFLVMIVEIVMLVIMAGCVGFWLAFKISINPQLKSELLFLVNQISRSEGDLDSVYHSIKPYVIQPGFFFWGLAIFSGIIPLIEEILKPIAIWALAGRKISPQEGFVGGLLCGAGFALMENLLYFQMVVTPDEWLFVALGRIGTTALHMLVSGLVGWGLARTWREGKWIPLIVMTLSAVSLHGFWNAVAMLAGIVPVLMPIITESPRAMIVLNAPLVLLSVASLMGIILINLHFRRKNQVSEVPPTFEGEDAVGYYT